MRKFRNFFSAATLAVMLFTSGCGEKSSFQQEPFDLGKDSIADVVDTTSSDTDGPSSTYQDPKDEPEDTPVVSGGLDHALEEYFVQERVDKGNGVVLGVEPTEAVFNEEATEYVNRVFVQGKEQALQSAEFLSTSLVSKLGDVYELHLPVHTVEEREGIRSQLSGEGVITGIHHLLSFADHSDNEQAEQEGGDMWAYNRIALPQMLHAISFADDLPGIAVIDSGFDSPELNIVEGYDYADNDDDFSPSHLCIKGDHGNAVAGIIAAQDNGVGLNGVMPNAPIYAYKVQNANVLCPFFDNVSEGAVIASLVDVLFRDKIKAVNMSVGIQPEAVFLHQKIEEVVAAGKLVVAAANNNAENTNYLNSISGLVVVGGTQLSNGVEERWTNSNYWTQGGRWLAAPGQHIALITNTYSSGTSYSAPFVTGLGAALMLLGLSSDDAYITMRASADQVWVSYPGIEGAFLWHRINAYRAVCSVTNCEGEVEIAVVPGGEGEGELISEVGEGEGEEEQLIGEGEGEGEGDMQSHHVYSLYAIVNPPHGGVAQVYSIQTTASCEKEMEVLTDVEGVKRSLRFHRDGFVYQDRNDNIKLWRDQAIIHIGEGKDPQPAPADSRIAYHTVQDQVYVVEPGHAPQFVFQGGGNRARIVSLRWQPSGSVLVVMQHHPDFNGNSDQSFTFKPLDSDDVLTYMPQKKLTTPLWSDENTLQYFCAHERNNRVTLDSLCRFHYDPPNRFEEEVMEEDVNVDFNPPTYPYAGTDGSVIFGNGNSIMVREQNGVYNLVVERGAPFFGVNPLSSDAQLIVYRGRPDGFDTDAVFLYNRETGEDCLLLGNAIEAVWREID